MKSCNTTEKFPYKKGTNLLSESPFAYILKGNLNGLRCDFCFQSGELLKCSSCKKTSYCDRNCQKSGWAIHKTECLNIKNIGSKVVPDTARLLARIVWKLQRGGAREQSFYSARKYRVFMDLMSHYQDIKSDPIRMEHFEALCVVLNEYMGKATIPNPVELLQIYGRMIINTFNILDAEMQSIGTGMYLAASIVDHSCDPNAVVVFDGTTINIRTLVDLPALDWSRVYISYIDLLKLPAERQQDLQNTYYFLCQCKRCLDIEELGLMTSCFCQNSSCSKIIPFGTQETGVICPQCNTNISTETREEITEIADFTKQQLSSMKNVAYLDVCNMCLKKQECLFGPMNLLRVQVIDMAMDSCIELGHYDAALQFGSQLIQPFRQYYGELHPLTGILFMKMGKLALLKNEMVQARQWLKSAGDILRITHGDSHPFLRNDLYQLLRQCANL